MNSCFHLTTTTKIDISSFVSPETFIPVINITILRCKYRSPLMLWIVHIMEYSATNNIELLSINRMSGNILVCFMYLGKCTVLRHVLIIEIQPIMCMCIARYFRICVEMTQIVSSKHIHDTTKTNHTGMISAKYICPNKRIACMACPNYRLFSPCGLVVIGVRDKHERHTG